MAIQMRSETKIDARRQTFCTTRSSLVPGVAADFATLRNIADAGAASATAPALALSTCLSAFRQNISKGR